MLSWFYFQTWLFLSVEILMDKMAVKLVLEESAKLLWWLTYNQPNHFCYEQYRLANTEVNTNIREFNKSNNLSRIFYSFLVDRPCNSDFTVFKLPLCSAIDIHFFNAVSCWPTYTDVSAVRSFCKVCFNYETQRTLTNPRFYRYH